MGEGVKFRPSPPPSPYFFSDGLECLSPIPPPHERALNLPGELGAGIEAGEVGGMTLNCRLPRRSSFRPNQYSSLFTLCAGFRN